MEVLLSSKHYAYFYLLLVIFMCVNMAACTYVLSCVHAVSSELKRVCLMPWNGITDSCELPLGCWEPNPVLMDEQKLLLTADPTYQFPGRFFLTVKFVSPKCSHIIL